MSHGAALREYTGDAVTADLVASNWRQAGLAEREHAMASYAEKLTLHPAEVTEADLEPLRAVGLDDHQVVELVQVVGMFNLTNRVSTRPRLRAQPGVPLERPSDLMTRVALAAPGPAALQAGLEVALPRAGTPSTRPSPRPWPP